MHQLQSPDQPDEADYGTRTISLKINIRTAVANTENSSATNAEQSRTRMLMANSIRFKRRKEAAIDYINYNIWQNWEKSVHHSLMKMVPVECFLVSLLPSLKQLTHTDNMYSKYIVNSFWKLNFIQLQLASWSPPLQLVSIIGYNLYLISFVMKVVTNVISGRMTL